MIQKLDFNKIEEKTCPTFYRFKNQFHIWIVVFNSSIDWTGRQVVFILLPNHFKVASFSIPLPLTLQSRNCSIKFYFHSILLFSHLLLSFFLYFFGTSVWLIQFDYPTFYSPIFLKADSKEKHIINHLFRLHIPSTTK